MAWTADGRWVRDAGTGLMGATYFGTTGYFPPNVDGGGGYDDPGSVPPVPFTAPSSDTPVVPPVTTTPVVPPAVVEPAPVIAPPPTGTPIDPTTLPATTPPVTPPATATPTTPVTTTPTTPPAVVPPPSAIPTPTALPLPAPITMPGAPAARDASVANQLTGLLASDSPYINLARNAGMRTAGRRGLLNSSIAAGSAEAAAIAAAAPIASQDAAQIQQTNQTELESWSQLRNASTLQNAQFAMEAWKTMDSNIQQILLNNSSNASAMERLLKQGEIESAIALMREDKALTQTQINANVSLLSGYMSAFSQLASNPDLPASVRDAYIAEFQKVTGAGQNLVNFLSGMKTIPAPSTGAPGATPISTAPKTPWTGPTPAQIMAMYGDGKSGGYGYASAYEAGTAYNKWAAENGVKLLDLPAPTAKKKGILGGLVAPLPTALGWI